MNGHFWTIAGHLSKQLVSVRLAPSRYWTTTVPDDRFGRVRLSGRLSEFSGSSTLVLIVHGLGGSSQSPYMFHAAAAAHHLGLSSLRLDLRGADLRGEDFFHAGLGTDIAYAVRSPEVARYDRILLFGYSLGGHVCLSYATSFADARVKALVAVCSPLNLAPVSRAFDAPQMFTYRRHVLAGLQEMYRSVSRRRSGLPLPPDVASKITRIQDWDDRVVAPRYGFKDKEHYYQTASVASRLPQISMPTLLLSSPDDPMVPRAVVSPYWAGLPSHVHVVEKSPGGHVSFPASFSLGEEPPPGLELQVIRWMMREAGL